MEFTFSANGHRGETPLRQFTLRSVRLILERDPAFKALISNPGLLAVAAAIRGSTLGPQAARYGGSVDHREIRYGLLSDLRNAHLIGRQKLVERVTAFISAFNQEGSRRRTSGLRSKQIQAWEIEAFVSLLERPAPAAPVGSLVCGLAGCIPEGAGKAESEPALTQAVFA